ncbi:hypothetical protein GQX73_g4097 [Xylaria multiplex]|uniref:SAM-dependent MTase RsmB/NOP-type domain-containing protein n=1 Tax=Xylaria multiplex TaxID=323545 RepID=A0A7C8IYI7_9PEZI|nr:hypothetical protein GQX73_g4097 [Xylaria multiplex]
MGVGNRFKHQGVPEPLSEAHFAKLKRKAGHPVEDVPETKKRKAQNGKANGKAKTNGKSNDAKVTKPPPPRNSKVAKPKSKKGKPEPELDLDDMSDGIGGGFSDEDMSGLDDDDALVDDFLGSDDSVYDSEGEGERRAMFSEDEDESDGDAEERLTAANIVGLSRKLDKEKAEEEAAAEAEFQETIQTNIDVPHVLEGEEEQNKTLLAPDLQLLRQRISDTIRVLDDFANLSEPGSSRSEYTAQLQKDICAYYGYSEFLAEKLLGLFPPREALAFFDANETPRPIVIRTNTLKTSRRELASALINRGVTLEPVGLQIFESNVPLGATPEYLAGHYILQAASSFLPCMALAPQEVDMASAPGGKTTYLAALMKNTGCVFANDPSKARSRGLIGNVHRLGVRNVIVCNYDARDFPKVMGGFDRVLLVIAKDPSVKTNKTEKDFITIPHTQKQLLLGAIDSVNHAGTGGFVVYSTCSVSVEENEMVVQYALKKRYPHTLNLDGFYVAKFQKTGPTPASLVKSRPESAPKLLEEVIDKTPILADDKAVEGDDFGGFDDDEDAEYIQRAKRNAMRKRGLDPKALEKPKAESKAKINSSEAKSKAKSTNGSKPKNKRVSNPKNAKSKNGLVKFGEHNLGTIRSNQGTCELCTLIGDASQGLKPWWPIAEFLDRPERITCAFFRGRNRLGSGVLTRGISQTDVLLDQFFAEVNPNYSSIALTRQKFLDSLNERGISVDASESTADGLRKNNTLNRVLVLAGLTPVESGAQTFMQLHPCLYPIPTVDDYANGTSPSAVFPTGRTVRPDVNIQLLKRWYNICLQDHGTTCEQPSWLASGRAWPRNLRLIDVTRRCIVDAPATCVYLTLSYVWGLEKDPFQSTTANLASLQVPGGLDSHLLPKTIEDAIWLTRELGVDYLWVDRLCVVQDSGADKAIQLPQMDLVYSSSAMTIVAASGVSLDGLSGVNGTPRTIDRPTARVTENLGVMNILHLDEAYQASEWRTRGWTFQEGLCSRRSLIIATDQVFWSCESAKYCETIAFEDFPTTVAPGDIVFQVLSGHRIFSEFGGANFNYSELSSMLGAYNKRHLSEQSDILNAFTGVLNRVSVNSGHEFYWGHSVSCMFGLSLAWINSVWYYDVDLPNHELPARRRESHRLLAADGSSYEIPFPSWSWLGWMHLDGVTRSIPKQVNIPPELNIMKLDVHGKAAPLNASGVTLESKHQVSMYDIDESTSAGWKQDTAIPPHMLHEGGEFKDSGRLLFWTSHAELEMRGGKLYSSADTEREIGALLPIWPHQVTHPEGKFSFVVVERKLDDFRYRDVRAERRLYLLLVEWVDRQLRVAERDCAAEVDEAAWVEENREWVLVTLT